MAYIHIHAMRVHFSRYTQYNIITVLSLPVIVINFINFPRFFVCVFALYHFSELESYSHRPDSMSSHSIQLSLESDIFWSLPPSFSLFKFLPFSIRFPLQSPSSLSILSIVHAAIIFLIHPLALEDTFYDIRRQIAAGSL